MTRLYIPEIGDQLRLVSDWNFTLVREGRNDKLWKMLDAESHPSVAERFKARQAAYAIAEAHDRKKVEVFKPYSHTWPGGARTGPGTSHQVSR